MTPTKESLDRARVWLDRNVGCDYCTDCGKHHQRDVNSLALEFDRIAIEEIEGLLSNLGNASKKFALLWAGIRLSQLRGGQIDAPDNDGGDKSRETQTPPEQLVEHPRQGTALNQPRPLRAGEKEG